MSGYNDKLCLVINTIINRMKLFECAERDFRSVVQKTLRAFRKNFTSKYKEIYLTEELRSNVIRSHQMLSVEKVRRLRTIKFVDMQKYWRRYCGEMRMIALMQGNLTSDTAKSIMHAAAASLQCDKIQDVSSSEL